jgi:UDP-glucose 4-epimerase
VKVIVLGGAGYIGSVASHRLIEENHDVVVIDNLSQGHREAIPGGAVFENVDVVDRAALTAAVRRHRPQAVMHFAALTIASESVRDPAPFWLCNAGGTLALLDAMREADVPALVASSTAAVYGIPAIVPVPEDDPLTPINPYGASKLAAELAISSYAMAYGLSVSLLRYFNVAGALGTVGEDHRPETHLIPNVIDTALGKREALSIFGADFPTPDGTAVRDYVHVEDLIDAHILALNYIIAEGKSLPPLNLGTRAGASVRDVIEAVERVTGLAVPCAYRERRPGDPPALIADATLARTILGWEAKRSTLDQVVQSAWQWRLRFPNGYRGTSLAR